MAFYKQNITLILTLLIASVGFTQINITDPDFDQANPIDCSLYQDGSVTNFFDNGGAGNYLPNANDTIVICPDLPNGPKVTVAFGINAGFSWNVDGSDFIYVFDGPDVNAPLLGVYNSVTNPNGFTHTSTFENNPSGCLTIVFISDGANEGTGWGANVTCSGPAQPFTPTIEGFINGVGSNAMNPLDTGYVDICFGDSVLLVATIDTPYSLENNGFGYSQNPQTNFDFEWEFSDGTVITGNDSVWFTPTTRNGFFVNLLVSDIFPQTLLTYCRIRVSQLPSFAGTGPLQDTVCFGSETILLGGLNATDTVGVDIPGGNFTVGGSFAGLLPLPDGSGVNYNTVISMGGFPTGATYSSPNDLQDLCVTMEHSYLGDLEMWLECPNGTTVTIFNANVGGQIPGGFGGGGTYLGDANDTGNGTPGIGFEYCFSSINNDWGTMEQEFAANNTIPVNTFSVGNSMNPNGIYLPEQTFADFTGCPLNGDWTLYIRDNLSIDDGFIFEWGLFFDAALFPNSESYQNTVVNSFWSSDPTITSGTSNDTLITVLPDSVGDFFYTFNVEDNFGCFYDTTVLVHVLDTTIFSTTTDTTIFCRTDDPIPLFVSGSGLEPINYQWADGSATNTTNGDGNIDGVTPYIVTITDACGVVKVDTAYITVNQTLAIDTMFQFPSECGLATGAVSGIISGETGTPLYTWTGPGANNPNNINASVWEDLSSGWYYFSVEDDVCAVNDSIFLEQDPPPTASFTPNPAIGNAPLNVTFINNSQGGSSYVWDFDNGLGANSNQADNQNTLYSEEGVYLVSLIVTEGACADTAYQTVVVNLLLPLSFDTPNIFTPNNDSSNDFFTLNGVNVETLELVVLNRWGNVVFESTDINAAWNGQKNNSGNDCSDGVYLYKYVITGQGDQRAEGHGFVHLAR